MRALRGITWDHPRGVAPMLATAAAFCHHHPGFTIEWQTRSLWEFGAAPLEPLVERYDLLVIDHPFIGGAVNRGLLLQLDSWLPQTFLDEQRTNSVGASYTSYSWQGHQWALAIDVAAQVSAYRPDLLEPLGLEVPQSWEEVEALTHVLPEGKWIAIPLTPTDAFCSFIALCHGIRGPSFWASGEIPQAVGIEALKQLAWLRRVSHPVSLELRPPQLLDFMAQGDSVVYVPLIFGYSNYARPGFAPRLIQFADAPMGSSGQRGSVLGGAGLAISARTHEPELAVAYAMYVAGEDCQRTIYFQSGGQPGHRRAWEDPELDAQVHGFFSRTLRTVEAAYLRPRERGFPEFQEQAGKAIYRFLLGDTRAEDTIAIVNSLYQSMVIAAE